MYRQILIKSLNKIKPLCAVRSLATTNAASVDKKLFTPGPLGVSMTTKQAMLRDLGSRDTAFIDTVKKIRSKLLDVAGVPAQVFTSVPVQGSGTYAVEAVFHTALPTTGKALLLVNGAYGKRMKKICELAGLAHQTEIFSENMKVAPSAVEEILQNDPSFTLVAVVHCETSSGIINPVSEIGCIVKNHIPDASYFVDAMSSFGAIPLDLQASKVDYLVSSANKCLEGVPGFSFVIARLDHLLQCKGNSTSLSLDLYDQYDNLEKTHQFRFTPPTHSMLAFQQALLELEQEGGVLERGKRYQKNCQIIREGMKKFGFREFLDSSHKGYIITSFCFPKDPKFVFEEFYHRLNEKGLVIYPGKVLDSDCFRIGNIGHLFPDDMTHLLQCIKEVCQEMEMSFPINN
ncbi:uncharacterized protein LOC106154550 isoform X1 [Lingula anatina]|uniref:Alanine--glyoxylate aminotransferase n=2 Tax=Lingula anatina TaxID=7574 RepID=A0A1S3HH81_LINAN|nr:uncharacterized protein LOC106154550 isoform X1 [Lingula anatina]|eukprot:XP_013384389.2 uncharacterized protein LOC106154550 isoform X1 [Lingula anatina]